MFHQTFWKAMDLIDKKKRVLEMISNHIESKHNKKDKNVKFVIFILSLNLT